MRKQQLWLGLIAALLIAPAGTARDLPSDLRSLFDGFAAHRRAAIAYLRAGNLDLGAVEIERLRARWLADRRLLPATATDPALAAAMAETETLLADSLTAADRGDAEAARSLLVGAALPLTQWRHLRGIRLFSDCIAEAGQSYERLDVYRTRAPELRDTAVGERIVVAARDASAAYARCNEEASAEVRNNPEFRRLLDGMIASLGQVSDAIAGRDGARLHRLLIEQRALERLLAFRYG
jgi:hypothetical protein